LTGNYDNPMSSRSREEREQFDEADVTHGRERLPCGEYVPVTHYRDGSSRVHWGGMGGTTAYDANGEEA